MSPLCRGSVEISVPGYSSGSTELYDFPLRVDLDETRPDGFRFSQAAADGADVRFTFDDPDKGVAVSNVNCRVDSWNEEGKALVYVNVPRLNNNSKLRLRMYWGAYDASKLPANDPSGVSDEFVREKYDRDYSATWNKQLEDQSTNLNYIAFSDFSYTPDEEPEIYVGHATAGDYVSRITFTVADLGSASLGDFPVLIRLANDSPKGFRYDMLSELPGGRGDLRFFDSNGVSLNYEVEKWDESGESLIWVLMPTCRTGAQIVMAWGQRDGAPPLPEYGGGDRVWADYIGVWHMDETIDAEAAKKETRSHDDSGHGHDLVPKIGPEGVFYTQESAPGVFGNSRINDTKDRNKRQGSYFAMANTEQLALNGVFTLSFWLKVDDYMNWPQLASRRTAETGNNGFQIDMNVNDRKQLIARGDTQTGSYQTVVDQEFKKMGFVHLAFVYNGTKVSVYSDGVLRVDEMTIGKASDNGVAIALGNRSDGKDQSVWGKYDEVRLHRSAKSAAWIAAEHAQGVDGFFTDSGVVTDYDAVRKDWWKVAPSISKSEWLPGTYPTWDDINRGVAGSGRIAKVEVFDRRTGGSLGETLPTEVGDYRVVFKIAKNAAWGALSSSINFSISRDGGSHDLGKGNARVLLANDDDSVEGGIVLGQNYDEDWSDLGSPYWQHLERDGSEASTHEDITSTSSDYNFGGGTRHLYRSGYKGQDILWDLTDIRIGNTFNNYLWVYYSTGGRYERYDEGLDPLQNYLPWNERSKVFVGWYGDEVGPYHAFAGQLAMQNSHDAAIVSSCYPDGIGTIYFDTVNGFTDNVFDADGNCNYRLTVEITTNGVTQSGETFVPEGLAAASYTESGEVLDILKYAVMQPRKMRVLHFAGEECIEDFETDELSLTVQDGGSYTNFYRVIVPVNLSVPCRFRIRRSGIDENYSSRPDADSYILVDNVICSQLPTVPQLEPYGRFDEAKTGKQVLGWEGAFVPAFPAVADRLVYGRAKATLPDGSTPKAGQISAATMHYRWHYIEQSTTDWYAADLDPTTLTTLRPLVTPDIRGDFDFWFDLHQNGGHYLYADYSGTGLGLGKSGYTEAIHSVTNRAADYVTAGDWFVRTREGRSQYAAMTIVVKTSPEDDAPVSEIGMDAIADGLWRGFYRLPAELEDGLWWRVEARDPQEDGSKSWNYSTNWLYVADWASVPPEFPAANRLSEGTAESAWSRLDGTRDTGYLMFQLDQNSLGVTVNRADYQDFNDWSSAAKGYFVGSSNAETNGTSSDVKFFDQRFNWPDTLGYNDEWWSLIFDGKLGSGWFKDTATFPSSNYAQWTIGKGRWVNEYYDDRDGRVALKMAGCGEGNVTFSDRTLLMGNWPRGLDTVTFKARVAQDVSPAFAAYSDEPKLTNYTFMARGCFDMKKNMGFSGNASLTLFGYYRPTKGAYSARWEQIKGVVENNPRFPNTMVKPNEKGQRLVVSRWDYAGEGDYTETVLMCVTNSAASGWNFPMPVMPCGEGETATNNLLPMCLSVYHDAGATYVVAGVRVTNRSPTRDELTGVTPNTEIDTYLPEETTAPKQWYFATARDTSSKRLKSGGYGVLSSNCEGMFLRPQLMRQPAWPSKHDSKEKVATEGLVGYSWALLTATRKPGFENCFDDIYDGWWEVDSKREEAFGRSPYSNFYGFTYVPPHQTVLLETRKFNDNRELVGEWTTLDTISVDSFGTPGATADYGNRPYRISDDVAIRLKTGGTLDDYRTDVVIADVVPTQWRGSDAWSTSEDDWDWAEDRKAVGSNNYYGSTNIIYTTGWVKDRAVRLSARRSQKGYACSIRSPLFDGYAGRGVGLGMFAFTYRKPTENIRLKVQIVTNYISQASQLHKISRSVEEGDGNGSSWLTLTNLNYSALMSTYSEQEGHGTFEYHLGMHGVQGIMRVAIDDSLVSEVAQETDQRRFGEIDILQAWCRDSPALDKGCWWGWNLQTIGDARDSQHRMYLPDWSHNAARTGMSLALNDSLRDGVGPDEDLDAIGDHMPFLQSPTFDTAVVGQITFRARKYDQNGDPPDVEVAVYGALESPDALPKDSQWDFIDSFVVTNRFFEPFTCKVSNKKYYALRLGIVGVVGTKDQPREPKQHLPAARVMIDEVSVSEPVSAMLSFRNVGAFRHGLETNNTITAICTASEQPLCNENWGVQAEVFPTMLGDEIDPETDPRVTLHWYVGTDRWGFENWRDVETGHAELTPVCDANWIFRSSYVDCPGAVMVAQKTPNTVVQYMLEVVYRTITTTQKGKKYATVTNWLDSTSWKVPEWYAPINYNADPAYGKGETFAAFNILDTIAPGWAWLNEMNILGAIDGNNRNTEQYSQFVEVCVPAEADLTGWRIRFLEPAVYEETVLTNYVARFGTGGGAQAPGHKRDNVGIASNKVFRCLGVQEGDILRKSDGTLDGVWYFSEPSNLFKSDGTCCYINERDTAFGVQLLRPSGIIEHSIVVIGTNRWGRIPSLARYDPTNVVALLNRKVPGSRFFYPGEDGCGALRTVSVTSGQGEAAERWNNAWAATPGRINMSYEGDVQQIDPLHPTPSGDSIVIYASVDNTFGHIRQQAGGPSSPFTTGTEIILLRRESPDGTNIVYEVDPWYELGTITTNGVTGWSYVDHPHSRLVSFNVGKGATDNINVMATAKVDSDLTDKYGLTPQNPYTPAVMDWLVGGSTLRGSFANPGSIALADLLNSRYEVITNLSLTEMYWMDMDPTVGDLALKVHPMNVWQADAEEGSRYTNEFVRVFMMITNRASSAAWSPYVLRGVAPKEISWDYVDDGHSSQVWTSVTFKVKGILANSTVGRVSRDQYIPLNMFVFHEGSFCQDDTSDLHGPRLFTADIEMTDPRSPTSPGAAAGWYDWCREHGWAPVWYTTSLDTNMIPVGVEVLRPESNLTGP